MKFTKLSIIADVMSDMAIARGKTLLHCNAK